MPQGLRFSPPECDSANVKRCLKPLLLHAVAGFPRDITENFSYNKGVLHKSDSCQGVEKVLYRL